MGDIESPKPTETESPKTKTEIAESPEEIDKRIHTAADKKLLAREQSLEIRELKLNEQTRQIQKMLDEAEQGGQGIATPIPAEQSNKDYANDLIRGKMNVKATNKNA